MATKSLMFPPDVSDNYKRSENQQDRMPIAVQNTTTSEESDRLALRAKRAFEMADERRRERLGMGFGAKVFWILYGISLLAGLSWVVRLIG